MSKSVDSGTSNSRATADDRDAHDGLDRPADGTGALDLAGEELGHVAGGTAMDPVAAEIAPWPFPPDNGSGG
jgi:hypothetical protein